ncbi:arginase [Hydrogenophaga sp. 5NK40-0174]|uniref:arginase n=1 Tax=Hydrogenophaga sp. 5NK40-0174 TaxID=3127649 RepID=UPI0031094AF3
MSSQKKLQNSSQAELRLFGYACGIAGQFSGSKKGPEAVKVALSHLPRWDMDFHWADWIEDTRSFSDVSATEVLEIVSRLNDTLARSVAVSEKSSGFPVLIGGDHSAAVGFWSGVSEASRPSGSTGLIWLDAHMDSHTPETSPNGYVHGMPLAALLGYGDPRLRSLLSAHPKMSSEHVCLIGTRDFETEERAFLEQRRIRVFYMSEVKERGLASVVDEAMDIAGSASGGYGVTLDLDALDPQDAPGVSTPSPGGVRSVHLLPEFYKMLSSPKCVGLEISEFNPGNDVDGRTIDLILNLLKITATCRERYCA